MYHIKEKLKIRFWRRIRFMALPTGLVLLLFLFVYAHSPSVGSDRFTRIENGFHTPPDSIQTSVYWYWVSDNISKEGVVRDLEAMKKVGINRAFIGNIGLDPDNPPYGNVKIFSDEWWDILHTALKTATALNIQIGIFNSPGWSQSGGPWIKPEQAMRYLASSEMMVTGPQKLKVRLEKPDKDFQDVRVIAYPVSSENMQTINAANAKISSSPVIPGIEKIADGDNSSEVTLSSGQNLLVDFVCPEPRTIRSISVFPGHNPTKVHAELMVQVGTDFHTVKSFDVDRSNPNLIVGFDPYGPVVISLPETTSEIFRIIFSNAKPNSSIAEVCLSAAALEERYVEKSLGKMFQLPHPFWNDYLWPVQPEVKNKNLVIAPEKVLDISQYMRKDGMLEWAVPGGNWMIVRAGMVPTGVKNGPATPEAIGLEVDKMSREHIAYHFDSFLGEILRRIPAEDRKTFKVVVEDSYERGGQNWTDGFIETFKSRYGYDPVPFIPVIQGKVVQSRDASDRFLWDLRRLIADKIAYDYVGGLRDVSHRHGLTTWLENYGHWGFAGEFLQYGGQSDEVSGEFWSEGDLGDIENKVASSCAHIYGKGKVSAESFTCAGSPFSRYPARMKQRGDRFFTEGINNTLLHVYIEQPYEEKFPGMNAWFGNEFNRKNTWFYDMDMFIQYLKRCNFMLQQGTYVADVAYFIGEDAPKMTGICDPPLPQGYSFDYINGEVIRDRLSVKDGKLVLPDGMKYRILVLPKLETMRPELLEKIYTLVEQGAVVLGPAPKRSPSLQNYPEADARMKELTARLWGKVDGVTVKSANVGKGKILAGMSMQEALNLMGVKPDCKLNPKDTVLFIHRTLPEGDLYFISNQTEHTVTIAPEFRTSGKNPELWDATTGSVRDLPAYIPKSSSTVVPLKLEALESAFIVFRKKSGTPAGTSVDDNYPQPEILATLNGPWKVSFSAGKRGPAEPVTFEKLYDWTSSSNDSIKYYSGTAVYSTSFNLTGVPKGHRVFLTLGKLTAIAKVSLNGKAVGGTWTAPWQVEVTGDLKEGTNVLEIAVTNTWVNRLIGDSMLPADKRQTWCPVNSYKPTSPLQSSGLLGPVTIQLVKNITAN